MSAFQLVAEKYGVSVRVWSCDQSTFLDFLRQRFSPASHGPLRNMYLSLLLVGLIFELIPNFGPIWEESLDFLDSYGTAIDDKDDETRENILWMLIMIACLHSLGIWLKRVGNKNPSAFEGTSAFGALDRVWRPFRAKTARSSRYDSTLYNHGSMRAHVPPRGSRQSSKQIGFSCRKMEKSDFANCTHGALSLELNILRAAVNQKTNESLTYRKQMDRIDREMRTNMDLSDSTTRIFEKAKQRLSHCDAQIRDLEQRCQDLNDLMPVVEGIHKLTGPLEHQDPILWMQTRNNPKERDDLFRSQMPGYVDFDIGSDFTERRIGFHEAEAQMRRPSWSVTRGWLYLPSRVQLLEATEKASIALSIGFAGYLGLDDPSDTTEHSSMQLIRPAWFLTTLIYLVLVRNQLRRYDSPDMYSTMTNPNRQSIYIVATIFFSLCVALVVAGRDLKQLQPLFPLLITLVAIGVSKLNCG